MRWLPVFLFLSVFKLAQGQNWSVSEVTALLEGVSNNAVCEGYTTAGTFVYSFTGIDSTLTSVGIHLNSWRVNTQTLVIETLPDVPDTLGKIAAAANLVNGIIYVVGGYHVLPNGDEVSSNKVHRFDVAQNQFISDGSSVPVPIDDHVQVVYKDSLIFVVTGWSNTGNVPDVQIYNTYTNSWTVGTSTPNSSKYTCFGASGAILGDTIYYYGGAAGFGFAARSELRKGYINPSDPTNISWSESVKSPVTPAYRNAACVADNVVHWIGGSGTSYNYNAIAYNGSGLVEPANKNAYYRPITDDWNVDLINPIPMDLRGIANISDSEKYLIGGIEPNGKVSDKILRLEYVGTLSVAENLSNTTPFLAPNPASSHVTSSASGRLELYDIFGKLILEKTIMKNELLDIGTLGSGFYTVIINNHGNSNRQRLIISR